MNLTNPLEQEDWNFDIVDRCSIYLEGYILTPIGVLGIIGKKILYAAIFPWYNELYVNGDSFIKMQHFNLDTQIPMKPELVNTYDREALPSNLPSHL